MNVTIFDVEHGACALIQSPNNGPIALVDCGHNTTTSWNPAHCIVNVLKRQTLDHLFITNADQDHYSNLAVLKDLVSIQTFIKNPTFGAAEFEKVKLKTGPLSKDALAYKGLLNSHTGKVTTTFDEGMGGATRKTFYNRYPDFTDTNNLSLVTFIKFGTFSILFPGDLEKAGWLELLKNPDFRAELERTTILVASHHGRENGYCSEIFANWGPRAVVVSDKPVIHDTQRVPQYQNCVSGGGVNVVGQDRKRHVLTTRKDGSIRFEVSVDGSFSIYTEK